MQIFILLLYITSGYIKQLLQKKYSDKNTPERSAEEATYFNFVMFLDECEGR